MSIPMASCLRLFAHRTDLARSRALPSAGNSKAASKPITAITVNNSTIVMPLVFLIVIWSPRRSRSFHRRLRQAPVKFGPRIETVAERLHFARGRALRRCHRAAAFGARDDDAWV